MGATLPYTASFAERFAELVDGKTCREIAEEISASMDNGETVSKSAVHNYLAGTRSPKAHILSAIAEKYGVDPVWLLGYDVPKYKETPADDGEGEDRAYLINKIRSLSDEEVKSLRTIVDQVLSLRGK